MGGNSPLGYDVKDRKLVVNEVEASTVRLIFRRYAELGSVALLRGSLLRQRHDDPRRRTRGAKGRRDRTRPSLRRHRDLALAADDKATAIHASGKRSCPREWCSSDLGEPLAKRALALAP